MIHIHKRRMTVETPETKKGDQSLPLLVRITAPIIAYGTICVLAATTNFVCSYNTAQGYLADGWTMEEVKGLIEGRYFPATKNTREIPRGDELTPPRPEGSTTYYGVFKPARSKNGREMYIRLKNENNDQDEFEKLVRRFFYALDQAETWGSDKGIELAYRNQ